MPRQAQEIGRFAGVGAIPRRHQLQHAATDLLTSLIKAQNELRISRQQHCDLYDLVPVGILALDLNGSVLRLNQTAEEMLGPRSDVIGRSLALFLVKTDMFRFLRHIARLRRGERAISEDFEIGRHGRQKFAVKMVSRRVASALQARSQINVALLDITAQKQAEDQARRAYQQMERLVQERTSELRQANARLEAEMAERKELEKHVLAISENERRRIGQELHDGLGQELIGIGFLSEVLESRLEKQSIPERELAGNIARKVMESIKHARDLAYGLFPVELATDGLPAALKRLASTISDSGRIRCTFEGARTIVVGDLTKTQNLYRIAQEAVNNAVKHSRCRNVHVRLDENGERILLSVKDDGVGLGEHKKDGMGTQTMKYRADLVCATLSITSEANQGTEVTCVLQRTGRAKPSTRRSPNGRSPATGHGRAK